MLKALLFDLDGTLADTDRIHFQTWQDLLGSYDFSIDPSFYKQHFSGRRNQEILQDLLPQLSPAAREQFSWDKEAEFRRRANTQLTRLAGLSELLTWTDIHHIQRAVVTNAPRDNAQFMLQVLDLESTFPIVVLGDELPMGKPDPLPYQLGLSRVGVLATAAIAFEDSPSGLRSAVAAGIPTVGIATTHVPEELYDLGATLVVQNFADETLRHWLQQSLTQPVELVRSMV